MRLDISILKIEGPTFPVREQLIMLVINACQNYKYILISIFFFWQIPLLIRYKNVNYFVFLMFFYNVFLFEVSIKNNYFCKQKFTITHSLSTMKLIKWEKKNSWNAIFLLTQLLIVNYKKYLQSVSWFLNDTLRWISLKNMDK